MRTVALTLWIGLLLASLGGAQAADKELRMALISAPPTLGNPYGGVGPPSSFVWNALFDALVTPGKTGDLEPALALAWTAVEPTRWRFNLRPNITFSNGEAFDAVAVVTTLKWLTSDAGKRTIVGGEVSNIVDIRAVDAMTVDVLTNKPDAILPKRLTAVSILAPKVLTALGIEGFAQTPVGTGPFVLKTWKEGGGKIVVEANRTSWRKPRIDRIVFTVIPDPTARIQSILSGQIDIVIAISPDQASQFEGTDFQTVISPTSQVYGFAFATTPAKNKSVQDRRVRQALNYAVNKEAITKIVMRGTMQPAGQGATPVTFGYNPKLKPYAYDPAKAKALLAEAGYGQGLKLSSEIVTSGLPGDVGFLPLVQQDLRAVGVELEMRSVLFGDWLRKYTTNTFDTELFALSWNGAPYYDAIRALKYHSCDQPNPFFCDQSWMPAFAATGLEFDVEKRRTLLEDLAVQVQESAPSLYLYEVTDLSIVAPRIRNYDVKLRVPVYETLDIAEK
jgi:peptide/nickel transport system substrate-binding protein